MKVAIFFLSLLASTINLMAQSAQILGQLQEDEKPVPFATIALYQAKDSTLVKVEISNESGLFQFRNLPKGSYNLIASFLGYDDLRKNITLLTDQEQLDLGKLSFQPSALELQEAMVTASRLMVEIKSDRTVFNVGGTINSAGSNAITLLRQAPGVSLDNNDNIYVLGSPGVLVYIDGKRLPLNREDLSNYLQNLTSEQIDRLDIITNPGARYEAEGNAGIIDIRLKKDKHHGANGMINSTYSQGRHLSYSLNSSGNFRNKKINAFTTLGIGKRAGFSESTYESYINDFKLHETNNFYSNWKNYNFRLGTDIFLTAHHRIGVLFSGRKVMGEQNLPSQIKIYHQNTPDQLDSTLIVKGKTNNKPSQQTYNLNYNFDNQKGRKLTLDLDYGKYNNESERFQPNRYYNPENELISETINWIEMPSEIDIYTFKVDYEANLGKGTFGAGAKISQVNTAYTYSFFDERNGSIIRNNHRSNLFDYRENVFGGYINYSRSLGEKWDLSAGLRTEQTDAKGHLQTFLTQLEEPPVNLNYLNWFPNVGLNWKINSKNLLALNYGRRINRPDFNSLNPFNDQLSELAFEKGNPFLRPEIANKIQLRYTYALGYHFTIAYTHTADQITRLVGPYDEDPRASFSTWENLAKQSVISFNFNAPVMINQWWDAYFNLSASHLDNQADYGHGAIVNLQTFTYKISQQHTLKFPGGYKGEVSGYYSGPGVWGGLFKLEPRWSLSFGLQRSFLDGRLNSRISIHDLFYQSGWDGYSEFNNLIYNGSGRRDSRRISVNLTYQWGNKYLKSQNHKTGMESEESRVGH
ncbi:TonB-dependent receptor domain-containing protein [Xanthovirga aplysinae]|uniref:TonB-dependent receptor domain-containing protein n=1 Tax=Xanthovirga aplysinae TaxID=2529853 RepID=UPI0012BC4F54|nr:TonB-dependent receptor [Xanthovirga aplysinae]MTI32937.1 TonB-dependent receptor [Xanthovirga aplysinae]